MTGRTRQQKEGRQLDGGINILTGTQTERSMKVGIMDQRKKEKRLCKDQRENTTALAIFSARALSVFNNKY